MQAKYPASAYRGVRADIPGWLIGVPSARYLERAVRLLELRPGDSAYDVACGPGYNISRLVRAVGSRGMVTAVEDNPHLLACARRKVERAGGQNVRLLASLDPAQTPHADGIMIGYNPPIVLQRPGLLEAAWVILRPGGRLSAVGARCTTPAGRLAGPFVRLGLVLPGHPGDWHYWSRIYLIFSSVAAAVRLRAAARQSSPATPAPRRAAAPAASVTRPAPS